jgi:hypothetical protein
MDLNRRDFVKAMVAAGFGLASRSYASISESAIYNMQHVPRNFQPSSVIFRSVNGTPSDNLTKVLELMGGIEKLVGPDDIVLIKPNVQWWNQGAPNLAVLKAFVDLVMERPGGFKGEVVLTENCHRGVRPWESHSSGWANRFERNSDLPNVANYKELTHLLKEKYRNRYSTCHLIDVGAGNRRVSGPSNGTGYVYCDGSYGVPLLTCDNGLKEPNYRATIMTYPILKADKGTTIDFKNGIWEKGSYTGQPLQLINFSALNYHSTFCGMTSSIKNYMGIADLSGGSDPKRGARLTKDFYNFHSFSFNGSSPGPVPGMLGAAIGAFMKGVRKADLHITTAEWVGLSSRTNPPVAHTRAVLASTDPVALDYHSAKYILFSNSNLTIHNPDNKKGPLYPYLVKCAESGGGVLDERDVEVRSYDFQKKALQKKEDLVISTPIHWGTNPKAILKYLVLKYWKTD